MDSVKKWQQKWFLSASSSWDYPLTRWKQAVHGGGGFTNFSFHFVLQHPKESEKNTVRKHMQFEGQYNICCGLLRSVSTDKMVDLCHLEDFQLAWDGSGFCNRWLKKWFLGLITGLRSSWIL